jgi:ABC-2 type transport system permease protein
MHWAQFKAILWLRWRLTRNQMRKNGGIAVAITMIATVFVFLFSIGAGIGGVALGVFAGKFGERITSAGVLIGADVFTLAFVFFWLMGVVAEVQRSEAIDLQKLLHLPLTLGWLFGVNYIVSLISLGVVVFVPLVTGLTVGLCIGRGLKMILLFPLGMSFMFLVTAWTYCLRGWLVSLMVNPRKRRNIMVGVTLAAVLLGQLPNLYFNVIMRGRINRHPPVQNAPSAPANVPGSVGIPETWREAHGVVPVLWLPLGAESLWDGHVLPVLLCIAGSGALGCLGLSRAYRATLNFYRGYERGRAIKAVVVNTTPLASRRLLLVEKSIPGLTGEESGLTLAFIRSHLRAAEVRGALLINACVLIVAMFAIFMNGGKALGHTPGQFLISGAVWLTFLGAQQVGYNQFGFDRDGFRALVLSGSKRSTVILAKTISLGVFLFALGTALIIAVGILFRASPLSVVAGVVQLVTVNMVFGVIGAFLSIIAPYRIPSGSLRPAKPSGKTFLIVFLSQLLLPVLILPVAAVDLASFGLSKWLGWSMEYPCVLGSVLAAVLIGFLFKLCLEPLGRLLERREKQILLEVTEESD